MEWGFGFLFFLKSVQLNEVKSSFLMRLRESARVRFRGRSFFSSPKSSKKPRLDVKSMAYEGAKAVLFGDG